MDYNSAIKAIKAIMPEDFNFGNSYYSSGITLNFNYDFDKDCSINFIIDNTDKKLTIISITPNNDKEVRGFLFNGTSLKVVDNPIMSKNNYPILVVEDNNTRMNIMINKHNKLPYVSSINKYENYINSKVEVL